MLTLINFVGTWSLVVFTIMAVLSWLLVLFDFIPPQPSVEVISYDVSIATQCTGAGVVTAIALLCINLLTGLF